MGKKKLQIEVIVSALALAFLHDTFFIATGRTTLVIIQVLILIYGVRQFGWKGFFGAAAAGFAIAAALWATSPYSRRAATSVISQAEKFEYENKTTSTGQRTRWRLGSLARTSRRYQNIVGSLLNSFLFDFTEGWLYVMCVGMVLWQFDAKKNVRT